MFFAILFGAWGKGGGGPGSGGRDCFSLEHEGGGIQGGQGKQIALGGFLRGGAGLIFSRGPTKHKTDKLTETVRHENNSRQKDK